MGVDKMRVDEMGCRRNGNTPIQHSLGCSTPDYQAVQSCERHMQLLR